MTSGPRLICLLDMDHLSLLERDNRDSVVLQMRPQRAPAHEIATTISPTKSRCAAGLLGGASQHQSRMLLAYSKLSTHIATFAGIPIVPFDAIAAAEFDRLRRERIRIGSMDMKIAAIALATNAVLLSRNLSDFGKVPGLTVEDWTV